MYVSALTSQGNKIWNRKTTHFVSCPRMVVSVVPINVHYYIPNIRICVAVRQCRKQRYNYMGRKKISNRNTDKRSHEKGDLERRTKRQVLNL